MHSRSWEYQSAARVRPWDKVAVCNGERLFEPMMKMLRQRTLSSLYGGAICSIPRSFAYCWANLFQIFQDQKIAHAFTLKQSHNKHQDINHPVVYMP
jgi:hypothetical protein